MSRSIEIINDVRGSDDPILEMKMIQLVKGVHRHGMMNNKSDEQIERNLELLILSSLQKIVQVTFTRNHEDDYHGFKYSLYEYGDDEIDLDVEIRRW